MPTEFVDEDDRYLDWLADHPNGFVLNCGRKPSPSYLILASSSDDQGG
jgi:hypothetical protein